MMIKTGMKIWRSLLLAIIASGVALYAQPHEGKGPGPRFPMGEKGGRQGVLGGPGVPGGPGSHGPYMMQHRRWDMFWKTMEKLKTENPEEYQRLEELKRNDRTAYFQEVRKLMPAQFQTSSKVAELDRKCFDLSRQYRQARTDGEKEAIRKELEEAIQASSEALIEDLKARLEMMQKQLEDLEKNRDTLNKKRLDFMLNGKGNPRGQRPGGAMPPPPPPKAD